MFDLTAIMQPKDVFMCECYQKLDWNILQELLDLDWKLSVVGAIYIDSSGSFTPALWQTNSCFQDSSSKFLQIAVEKKVIQDTGMA